MHPLVPRTVVFAVTEAMQGRSFILDGFPCPAEISRELHAPPQDMGSHLRTTRHPAAPIKLTLEDMEGGGVWDPRSLPMSRHVPRHTFRWSPPPPPPPPLRVMVARPAQVTQVTQVPITLTQHDTAAAPCDTTHPMWRHRGTARPEPPPPPPAVAG